MNDDIKQVLTRLQAHLHDLVYVIGKTVNNPNQVYHTWFVNELEYVLASIALLEELKYVELESRQQTILTKAREIATTVNNTSKTKNTP